MTVHKKNQLLLDPAQPDGMLPSDRESEQALIGKLLSYPRLLFDVRALLDEGAVFFSPDLGDIYRACLLVVDAGLTLRPLTVMQQLRRSGQEQVLVNNDLFLMQERGSAGIDVLPTAQYLRELFIQRLAYEGASGLMTAVLDRQPLSDVLDLSRQLADTVSGKTSVGKNRSMGEIARATLANMQAAAALPEGNGIPTGSARLDRATGGWQTSDFVILAGRPGQGKTVVLLEQAKAAAKRGKHAAFFPLEMDATEATNRLISSECGIPYGALRRGRHKNGKAFTLDEWRRIIDATDLIASLPIHIYEETSTDVNDLIYASCDFQQRYGCEAFYYDYLQKCGDHTVRGDAYQVMSSISGKFKNLNRRLKAPVIAGSQLNRAVEMRPNPRPQLSDLRETGKLEEDANIVCSLFRPFYYKLRDAKDQLAKELLKNPNARFIMPANDYVLEIDILKSRNDSVGVVTLFTNVATNLVLDAMPAGFMTDRQISAPEELTPPPVLPDPKYLTRFPDDAHLGSFDNTVEPNTPF